MPTHLITTTDHVTLHVTIQGKGTPCLYLHGGPGSGSYWMQKFSAGLLEAHFTMIYLDQRGVSRSTSPQDHNYSMERMVKDCEEVRAALGIDRWLTMGHSFGGLLQIGYALSNPQSIIGMIMLNCGVSLTDCFTLSWMPKACEFLGINDTTPYTDAARPVIERLSDLGRQLRERDLFWKMSYAAQESIAVMNASFGEIPNWNDDQEEVIMQYPEYSLDYSAATATIPVPVLFFYGKTDWMIGPDHYRLAQFPQMLLWPSDGGHVAILENRLDLETALPAFQKKYRL